MAPKYHLTRLSGGDRKALKKDLLKPLDAGRSTASLRSGVPGFFKP
jgi:hypothetical protein